MDKPIIADIQPTNVGLEEQQEYYFCTCGRSKKQPFCDGSHAGTSFAPKAFIANKTGESWLCACKHSATIPFCDGTHQQFSKDQIGTEGPDVEPNNEESPQVRPTNEEPTVVAIHQLAQGGLSQVGHHGEMGAMGVPRDSLPKWDDLQILTAQFAVKPLMEEVHVGTELVIGPNSRKPLVLKTPLFVSDMSFGALSEEAKLSLAIGAELAGTGICSGEGGMLPEEQQANQRYFYELASAKFGYREENLTRVQAFHFKGGQGAKTGTGGHLPGNKVTGKIAKVRGLPEGTSAVSPPTFSDLKTPDDFKRFSDRVREITSGIPIGMKMSANHIEADIAFAIESGVDYIILDGRGGGTGAAPLLFRDHISVPTIPALARARQYLDKHARDKITLIITGGLRTPADFIKALCLGAEGVALSNAPMQAIGCIAARMCHTNNCPVGIATQQPELRAKVNVEHAAKRLANFFKSSTELMKVMARACGHGHLNQFGQHDITTWKREMAELTGVSFAGPNGALS